MRTRARIATREVVTAIVTSFLISVAVTGQIFCDTFTRPMKAVGDPGTDAGVVQEANEYLALIPDHVADTLRDSVSVQITTKDLAKTYFPGYSRIAGVTSSYRSSAGVHSVVEIENRHSAIRRSVIHETGHAFDAYCGDLSYSAEWNRIFAEEKYKFVDSTSIGDGHERSNAQEFFACVFSEYFMNRNNLIARAPQAYAFMDAVIKLYCPSDETSSTLPCTDVRKPLLWNIEVVS